MEPIKVLFVCIHNSARSQMAEEYLRLRLKEKVDVESAGIEPGKINPIVARLLKEKENIDITNKETQAVADLIAQKKVYDYVITVCDETSAERCPVFPGDVKRVHFGFSDPSGFKGSDEERLAQTQKVYDEIKLKLDEWAQTIEKGVEE